MSKFAKALEKIQEQKDAEQPKVTAPPKPNKSSYSIPKELEERMRFWDGGIRAIRDTKPDSRIVTHHYPNSLISEQYRMMRTNLKTHVEKEGGKVFLISSSVHAEGKTISAANLAISLTEMENVRVALIDADLRRGKIAEYLGLGKDLPGLSNLLNDEIKMKQAFVQNSLENLMIMPRGKAAKNASELVASQKFRVFVAELRRHFDYIIIDSPPILSVVDASLMARETDGLLMVIQSRKTPKAVVAQAHHLFDQAGVKMMGYILTNVEYQSADTRYYYHKYYYIEDVSRRREFEERMRLTVRKAESKFLELEDKFNRWWDKKILGEKVKEKKEKAGTKKQS